jgi:hypothetical protein
MCKKHMHVTCWGSTNIHAGAELQLDAAKPHLPQVRPPQAASFGCSMLALLSLLAASYSESQCLCSARVDECICSGSDGFLRAHQCVILRSTVGEVSYACMRSCASGGRVTLLFSLLTVCSACCVTVLLQFTMHLQQYCRFHRAGPERLPKLS